MNSTVIADVAEQYYTLLGVRSDGVASIVDLIASGNDAAVRTRAQAMLREHLSCQHIEIWCDGTLLEQLGR